MSDELKSAWQLALEKLEAEEATPPLSLSPEQKEEIAHLRRQFQAKIAEMEIGIQSSIQSAARKGDFEEVESLRAKMLEEKRRLNAELESRLEQVRKS